jgi:hypothetical protein
MGTTVAVAASPWPHKGKGRPDSKFPAKGSWFLRLHCNAPLRELLKAEVFARLTAKMDERYRRFTACNQCQGIFWQGTADARRS